MKKTIVLLFLVVCPTIMLGQKYINLHYLPNLSLAEARSYVGYTTIVVDPEVAFSSREALDWLRLQNPNINIICYINFAEMFVPMFPDKPWSIKFVNFLKERQEWQLKGRDSKWISFWLGMNTFNCSLDCPRVTINGKSYNYIEFSTEIYIENILKQYEFQGVLIDNCWEKVFWLGHYGKNKAGVDINGDGKSDDSTRVDNSWKKGMEYAIGRIQQFGGSDFILIANPGSAPFNVSTMFEDFPLIYANEKDKTYQAWYENMNLAAVRNGRNRIVIFNARKNNYWFTLCSSMLLDDVYFAYVQNSPYDKKWELNLGKPLGPAGIDHGEHCRKFENGTVYVDPVSQNATVVYNNGTIRAK